MDTGKPPRKDCASCRESLFLQPSGADYKNGVGTFITCCVHPLARVEILGKEYPQLTTLVRGDKKLCGPAATWWMPDVPIESPEFRARKENHSPQYYRKRLVKEEPVTVSPKREKPFRTPYRVN